MRFWLKSNNRKAFVVLGVLLMANILTFKWLRASSQTYANAKPSKELLDLEYMKEGVDFINWSYALLRYFKNNSPNT